jgi:hypothetical protein
VSGPEDAQPARKRKARNMPVLLLRAQPIVKPMYMMLQTWYMTSRPYSSDRGAMTGGPTAKPHRYIDTVRVVTVELVI